MNFIEGVAVVVIVWQLNLQLNVQLLESHSWRGVLDTTLCDKVCQWLATSWWYSLSTPVSSINKTDRHDITKILLIVALKDYNPFPPPLNSIGTFIVTLMLFITSKEHSLFQSFTMCPPNTQINCLIFVFDCLSKQEDEIMKGSYTNLKKEKQQKIYNNYDNTSCQ